MRSLLIIFFLISFFPMLRGQTSNADVLINNSINEQIKNYIKQELIMNTTELSGKTCFRKLMVHVSDTLTAKTASINHLNTFYLN